MPAPKRKGPIRPDKLSKKVVDPIELLSGEVIEPAKTALSLRQQGHSWAEVARQSGYASAGRARASVLHWLQTGAAARTIEEQRGDFELQVSRYESILLQWWELATVGKDEKAARLVLQVLGQLDRLQNFEERDVASQRPITVLIPAAPDAYVRELRELSEGTPEPGDTPEPPTAE